MVTYEILESVVNELDPVGLLAMGAPKDEYKQEVLHLLEIQDKISITTEVVQAVFYHWFSHVIEPSIASKIAGVFTNG